MTVAEVVVLEMRRLFSENLALSGLEDRSRATATRYSRMGPPLARAGGRQVNWRLLALLEDRGCTSLGGPGTGQRASC